VIINLNQHVGEPVASLGQLELCLLPAICNVLLARSGARCIKSFRVNLGFTQLYAFFVPLASLPLRQLRELLFDPQRVIGQPFKVIL
jgi:hypothetical protein